MTKILKSLSEFNEERRWFYEDNTKPKPNGIACPKCGEELWDKEPSITYTSNPPQKKVACIACDYEGYRIA